MDSENSVRKTRREEQRKATQRMRRILIHLRSRMDEELRPQGVTTAQLHVLKAVRDEPGASGAQLARVCFITPQSAQELLKELERGGWILREHGQGRVLLTRLTPEGDRLLKRLDAMTRAIEGKLWAGISDEAMGELNRVLEMFLANLGVE